jgi:AcrR family transcriptional regulator
MATIKGDPPVSDASTRERLLEAAMHEFALRGFAGGRIDSIAAGAGVNKQLIYYYFESKAGLYEAVLQHVHDTLNPIGLDDDESPRTLLDWVRARNPQEGGVRLVMFEALEFDGTNVPRARERTERFRILSAQLRQLQSEGRIDPALDAEMLLLGLYGVRLVPFLLPQIAALVTGLDADSEEFRTRYAEFVAQLVGALAPHPS